jgi:hypothetical protein
MGNSDSSGVPFNAEHPALMQIPAAISYARDSQAAPCEAQEIVGGVERGFSKGLLPHELRMRELETLYGLASS